MRKAVALMWAAVPALSLSALVHSTDPDIGSVGRLAAPATILSVVLYGFPVVVMVMVCLWVAVRLRSSWWIVPGAVASAVVALVLTVLQTPRPGDLAGIARPLLGGTVLVLLFLAAAVIPARALGWPRGSREQ